MRNWAAHLLVKKLALNEPRDILQYKNLGHQQIPGTQWSYFVHAIGVAVIQNHSAYRIDFDFSALVHIESKGTPYHCIDSNIWHIHTFTEYALRAKQLPHDPYHALLSDKERFVELVERATQLLFTPKKYSKPRSSPELL